MAFCILIRTAIIPVPNLYGGVTAAQPNPVIHTIVHEFATEAEAVDANQKINGKTSTIDPRLKSESFLLFTKTP